MAEDPKDVERLIQLYKTLKNITQEQAENLAKGAKSAGILKQEIEETERAIREQASQIKYVEESFNNLVDKLKNYNTGLGKAYKAFDSLKGIAGRLVDAQNGLVDLNEKDVKNLKEKFESQKRGLSSIEESLKKQLATTSLTSEKYNEIAGALAFIQKLMQENNDEMSKIASGIMEEEELLKKVNKALGIAGALMKGISKIPFLGDLPGMREALDDVAKKIKKDIRDGMPVSRAEALKRTFKAMGGVIKQNLTDPFFLLSTAISFMVKGFNSLDKAQTEFGRETGRNVSHMDTLNTRLLTSSDYIKTAGALTKQMGIHADAIFDKETLTEATEMVELMGLSVEEMGALVKLSKYSGTNLKENNQAIVAQLNNFNKVNRTGITAGHIFKEISKVSDSIALSLGGDPKKIAAAVSEAKKLGLSLEQVNKTADALLNFEDSISAELEAELLTGKDINLEQARLLALNNDMVGLTKEIGSNQEIINSFLSGNRIQQDAIGKVLGMNRDEMSKMIFDQRIVNGLSDEQLQKITGMTAEDMKRLEVQESINKSMAKMAEALAGPLEAFAQLINNADRFRLLIATVAGIMATRFVASLAAGALSMAANVAALKTYNNQLNTTIAKEGVVAAEKTAGAVAATGGFGAITIGIGIAAALAGLATAIGTFNVMSGDDVYSGKRTLLAGKNAIKLNDQDTVLAGTDGSIKRTMSGKNNASIDYNRMAEASAKAVSNALSQIQIQAVTYLDNTKVSREVAGQMPINEVRV